MEYPLPDVNSVTSLTVEWIGQAAVRGADGACDEGGYATKHDHGSNGTVVGRDKHDGPIVDVHGGRDVGPFDRKPKVKMRPVARSTNAKVESTMVR